MPRLSAPKSPSRRWRFRWRLRWHFRWTRGFGEALSPHTFLISAVAAVVGLFSGYIALGLLKLIYLLTGFFFHGQWSNAHWNPLGNHLGLWIILVPVIGGVLVGLMIHFWEPTLKGHGIPEAMQAVLIDKSIVRGRVAFLKPLATALAIGTGGPFGAEGPIIQTGAAIGSLVGQRLRLNAYDRRVLLAAGAGGGMAATFMAPLAGLMVAIELIVLEFRARSFFPIAIACVVADAIAVHYRGTAPMFPMPHFALRSLHELWLFALLGVVCGLVAWVMTLALFWIEDRFDHLPLHPVAVWAPTIGALLLGVIGYFYPRVLGTSYGTIADMLGGHIAALLTLKFSIAKFWALVITLGSGTTGGVFAPSLVVGGGVGAAYAALWGHWLPGVALSATGLYALAAMAAVFGGIARAPFTAVIFLFELSRNGATVLPLLACVMMADALVRLLSQDSMMTGKLAKRGLYVSQDFVAPLFQLWTADIGEIMQSASGEETAKLLQAPGAVQAQVGDSIAAVAHRLIEKHADCAVVMSRDHPPHPVGVARIADILALEDQRVRRHDLRERQTR